MQLQRISYPGNNYTVERGALIASGRVAELEKMTEQLQAENTELNRRLSAQNRPGKRVADCAEAATIILAEHVAGRATGRRAIHSEHPTVGRRRWEYGIALLRFAGIVVGRDEQGLIFNDKMTVPRAWQKLKEATATLESAKQLRSYLPGHRRVQ